MNRRDRRLSKPPKTIQALFQLAGGSVKADDLLGQRLDVHYELIHQIHMDLDRIRTAVLLIGLIALVSLGVGLGLGL